MLVGWNSNLGATGAVVWDLPSPIDFSANHLSVRVGNLFDGYADTLACSAVETENPLSFDIALETIGGERASIRLTDPPGVIEQDYDIVRPTGGCQMIQVMSTFRLPISCFFVDDDGFLVDDVVRVEFRVGEDEGNPTGELFVDSIEFTASSEEPNIVPDCNRFSMPF